MQTAWYLVDLSMLEKLVEPSLTGMRLSPRAAEMKTKIQMT